MLLAATTRFPGIVAWASPQMAGVAGMVIEPVPFRVAGAPRNPRFLLAAAVHTETNRNPESYEFYRHSDLKTRSVRLLVALEQGRQGVGAAVLSDYGEVAVQSNVLE